MTCNGLEPFSKDEVDEPNGLSYLHLMKKRICINIELHINAADIVMWANISTSLQNEIKDQINQFNGFIWRMNIDQYQLYSIS